MRRNEIEVGRIIYVLGHRDGRFGDVYIRPVAVNGLIENAQIKLEMAGKCSNYARN